MWNMNNKYGGIIWTNHALQRLQERGIKQSDAWATWKRPDKSRYEDETWVYTRKLGREVIEVVVKKNEKGEWIVLSVWSRPVSSGMRTFKKEGSLARLLKFLLP